MRSWVILVVCAACITVLVPGAFAEESGNTWFGTGGFFDHFSNYPYDLPEFTAANSLPSASYTPDGCPVGTGGAPYLINPLLTSGALCRGACGPDCPAGRCESQPMKILKNRGGTGTCMYTGVISCPTHPGCQQHDACYDYCEDFGYRSMFDMCHRMCNERAKDEYGWGTGVAWADITGSLYGPAATVVADWTFPPDYTGTISFSEYPVFTAYDTTRMPPTPAPVPSPTLSPTTPPPTTIPATTPSPAVTSGPDARLTIIMTGDLTTEDLEGTTVGWSVEALSESCSPTSGGAQCVLKFRYGTPVDLSVYPASSVRFTGWSGSCSGSGDCLVIMDGDKTVTALFSRTTATTPVISYQDYCTDNYPGSVYDPETQSCVFYTVTPTPSVTYAGAGSDLVLIPIPGGCCPDEPCTTQIATASGGTPPYTFTSGSLAAAPPKGMIIDVNGYLTGTAPSEMKTYRFSVCVKDMAGLSRCGESSAVVS